MIHQECLYCESNDVAHRIIMNGFKNKDEVAGMKELLVQHILHLTSVEYVESDSCQELLFVLLIITHLICKI